MTVPAPEFVVVASGTLDAAPEWTPMQEYFAKNRVGWLAGTTRIHPILVGFSGPWRTDSCCTREGGCVQWKGRNRARVWNEGAVTAKEDVVRWPIA